MWTLFFFQTLFLCSTLTRFAQNDFLPHNVYVYFLCGLMCTWIHESVAELICMRFFLRCFNLLCYASGFYMLLFVVRCLWCARACVCVIHWHCSAQLSMFNMEKRYRSKIIIIIIIMLLWILFCCCCCCLFVGCFFLNIVWCIAFSFSLPAGLFQTTLFILAPLEAMFGTHMSSMVRHTRWRLAFLHWWRGACSRKASLCSPKTLYLAYVLIQTSFLVLFLIATVCPRLFVVCHFLSPSHLFACCLLCP